MIMKSVVASTRREPYHLDMLTLCFVFLSENEKTLKRTHTASRLGLFKLYFAVFQCSQVFFRSSPMTIPSLNPLIMMMMRGGVTFVVIVIIGTIVITIVVMMTMTMT